MAKQAQKYSQTFLPSFEKAFMRTWRAKQALISLEMKTLVIDHHVLVACQSLKNRMVLRPLAMLEFLNSILITLPQTYFFIISTIKTYRGW